MENKPDIKKDKRLRNDIIIALSIIVLYLIIFGNEKGMTVANIWLILVVLSFIAVIVRHVRRKQVFAKDNIRSNGPRMVAVGVILLLYILFHTGIFSHVPIYAFAIVVGIVGGSWFGFNKIQEKKGGKWANKATIGLAIVLFIVLLMGPGTICGVYKPVQKGDATMIISDSYINIYADGTICQGFMMGTQKSQRCGTYKFDKNADMLHLYFNDGVGPDSIHVRNDGFNWVLEWGDGFEQTKQF